MAQILHECNTFQLARILRKAVVIGSQCIAGAREAISPYGFAMSPHETPKHQGNQKLIRSTEVHPAQLQVTITICQRTLARQL